jgi:hypothetical protein
MAALGSAGERSELAKNGGEVKPDALTDQPILVELIQARDPKSA